MMSMRKKILSIMLSVCMAVTMFPYGVFAAGDDPVPAGTDNAGVTEQAESASEEPGNVGSESDVSVEEPESENGEKPAASGGSAVVQDKQDAGKSNASPDAAAKAGSDDNTGDGDGTDGTDSGGDADAGDNAGEPAADDDEIVNHDVVINVEALKDKNDEPVTEAETGESLGVNFYAYNDNPNSTAIARIRVYTDQTTKDDNIKKVEVKEDVRKDIKLSILEGGKATEVNAKWGTDDKRKMDYMEFELPAGASVSVDLPYSVETGYDDVVEARIFSEYMVADKKGNYPGSWTASPSEVFLKWTGSFAWDNFIKSVSKEHISYSELIDGYFDPQELTYTFGATNQNLGKKTGVIYTKEMTLADTLTLPEGISLPDEAAVSDDKTRIVDGEGNAVYEVNVNHGDVKELKINSSQEISYKALVVNPDVEDASWNPYADLAVVLHLNNLKQSESSDLKEKKITNIAETEISSVNEKIEKYKGEGPAETVFKPAGALELEKTITEIKDKDGKTVSQVVNPETHEPEWQVGKKYVISYKLTVTNRGTSALQVKNLKDVLSAGLILDQTSLKVMVEGSEVSSYQKSITTDEDGKTTMILSGFSVPAAKQAVVTYNATVTDDDELFKSGTELTNIATLGNTTDTAKVRMVGMPKIVIKKAVVARFTRDVAGGQHVIRGTYDWKNEKYTDITIYGSYTQLGFSSMPDMEAKEKLLKEFYAEDYVLYEICVENTGDANYKGTIADSDPFHYYYDNGSVNYYNDIRHFYYATGETSYQSNLSYTTTINGVLSKNTGGLTTEPGTYSSSYGRKELKDRATSSSYGAPFGTLMGGIKWTFSGARESDAANPDVIKPGEELHQTTLIKIPGTGNTEIKRTQQSGSPNITDNYFFEQLASAYFYNYYSGRAATGENAYWTPKNTLGNAAYASEPGNSENWIKSNDIYHTVRGQISIDTGVISKAFPEIANNVKGSDFKTYYNGPGEVWKNQPTTDLHYFEPKSNQVILNYVYVYNDSSEPFTFKNKQLNIYFPQEFDWLGFVQANWSSTSAYDENGSYLPMTDLVYNEYNGRYNTSMGGTPMSGQYYNAGNQLWIGNCRNYSNYISESPRVSTLYSDYDPEHVKNYNYLAKQNSGSWSDTKVGGNYKYVQVAKSDTVINPYTGLLFYYAVKVNDPEYAKYRFKNSSACFFAEVANTDSAYVNNYSPIIEDQEYYVKYGSRTGFSNAGYSRAYTHYESSAPTFLNEYLTNLLRRRGDAVHSIVAGVSMRMTENHYYKIAVEKEVVKNDGEDYIEQYREGNKYKSDIKLNDQYDTYEWGYPKHDGIHRTVDGTVTWKTTVKNTGTDANLHDGINYSMLIDTIDSPYELAELYIPTLIYNTTEMNRKQTFSEFRVKLPLNAEGWTRLSNDVSVIAFDMNGQSINTDATSVPVSAPRIRVTRKLVKNGSVATGYDVSAPQGDRNVDAYRYIIEIAGIYNNGLYYPLLDIGESVDFYLTFATTDAIETNYNSFAPAFPMLGANDSNKLIVTNNAKETTISGLHKSSGSAAGGGSSLRSTGPSNTQNNYSYPEGPYYPSGPNTTYCYDEVFNWAKAVEYSDWTDTSYTDGQKTVELLNDSGEVVSSINSRTDGNMILPGAASPGAKMHINLMVESVLYESENYTYFDGLNIYDLYGTSGKFTSSSEKNLCGYDVDFSTIKLSDSLGRDYVLGTDYDIYYTDSNLVYTEHHPISPVNTLKYAADYSLLTNSSVTWKEYKAGDEVTIDDAHAFKIVLKNGKETVYNHRTTDKGPEWANFKMFVDYDAVVPDNVNVSSNYSYPNVLAYSASMYVKDSDEIKPFIEDTTAAILKPVSDTWIKITKEATNLDGTQFADEDAEFKYLLIRLKPDANNISAENTDAAATFMLKSGETVDLLRDSDKVDIIYSAEDDSGEPLVKDLQDLFITPRQQRYYLIEIDGGDLSTKPTTITGSYSMNRSSGYKIAVDLTGLETSDSEINQQLINTAGQMFDYIQFSKYSAPSVGGFRLEGKFENVYSSRDLEITKADEEGEIIYKESEFAIYDAGNTPVKFTRTDNGYKYDKDGTIDHIVCNGVVTLTDFPPGIYKVEEVTPPEGYELPEQPAVEVNLVSATKPEEKLYKLTINDPQSEESIDGALKVVKIDADTEEVIESSNARFQLYESKEEGAEPLLFKQVSGDDGTVYYEYAATGTELHDTLATTDGYLDVRKLTSGKTYYLVETQAPAGYELAGNTLDTALEVTIDRRVKVTEVRVPNKWVSGQINITKINSVNEQPILDTSAEFNLLDSEGNVVKFEELAAGSYKYDAEGEAEALLTDPVTGKLVVSGLPMDNYVLKEIKAPAGYKIDKAETEIKVSGNEPIDVSVENKPSEISLRVVKKWRLEGGRKSYPFKGVPFTLYKTNEDGTKAEKIKEGSTDARGVLDLGEIGWHSIYYLYEEVPEGYSGSSTDTVYLDGDGNIDLTAEEGTAIDVIKLDLSNKSADFIEEDGEFVYEANVLNTKNVTYGGLYASVSYKTIDNKKAAAEYDGLSEQTGYGYYYTEQDYSEGHYNYVDAVNPGDIVTYTLNVSNVSDYDFGKFSIIDRLPETDDTGVVNLKEKRDSEFTVNNSDGVFTVTVDGTTVDPSMYEVTFSDKTEFTNGDFNGTTAWNGTYETAKSVRIAFNDDFILEPGQKVTVTFDGKIGDEAKPGEYAWNDFAYRYTAITEDEEPANKLLKLLAPNTTDEDVVVNRSAKANGATRGVVITPEPPKVGVHILDGKTVIGGEKKFEGPKSAKSIEETFTFKLTRSDDLEYEVTYKNENGSLEALPADGLTVDAKAKLNGGKVKFEFPELHFGHTGKYEFDVEEVAGKNPVIHYDTAKYHVVVDGTNVADYSNEKGITPAYTLGDDNADTALFTNTKEAFGDLEITKKVEDDSDAEKNTEFNFEVKLTTPDGAAYTDDVNCTKGSYKETLKPQKGVVTISIRAGEKAVLTHLPEGTEYTVTETNIPDQWTQTSTKGTTGVIDDGTSGKAVSAVITNKYTEKKKKADCEILISKVNQDGKKISGAVFEIYKIDGDTEEQLTQDDYSWLDEDDQFVVGKSAFRIKGLEDGRYQIREVLPPEDYEIYNKKPIAFSIIEGQLDPDLNVITSNVEYKKLSDKKHQFTVTNNLASVKKKVKTGDDSGIMLYITVLLLGGLALAGLVYRRRRKGE